MPDMCGIVGYTGKRQAQPILIDCLRRLEYRGYDSSGIAVRGSGIRVFKDKIRVADLESRASRFDGATGIGHTRWATHGVPSLVNAHPHLDCAGKIAVVHNGVIANYLKLREQLTAEGHRFTSETDTEVLAHLIEKHYRGDLGAAVKAALMDVEGSYALVVLAAGERRLVAARRNSPLIIGIGDGENFIASDVPAVLDYTDRVVYLEDGDIATVTPGGFRVTRPDGSEVEREEQRIPWGVADIQKAGYEHFMLKEIHETPRVIRDTLGAFRHAREQGTGLALDRGIQDLLILACGTSYHAGLVGKYLIEELLGLPVRVELASEAYHSPRTIPASAAIVLTQSGETADVLGALRRLKQAGVRSLVITNVPGSSASRLANGIFYLKAGPEVSVAATKSFIAQLAALYQLALTHPDVNRITGESLAGELRQLPSRVQEVLDNESPVTQCARYLAGYANAFFLGRGISYPVALEGALKLKETAYIHAEGYAAGELKHGPFALLGRDTPVVAVVTPGATYEAMLTSLKEVKARQAPVIAVVSEADESVGELADRVIRVPAGPSLLSPVTSTVALQLLSYYTARYRGCPVDFPRNLAKSVTVE